MDADDAGAAAALQDAATRWVQRAVQPHLQSWDDAGEFPRALYRQAAELGWLGMGYPEALGGTPLPWHLRNALTQTLARSSGSGGLLASLFSHNIALPMLLAQGSAELQQRVVPGVLRGEQIAALGITEPGGGTDVAALRCSARRDGDSYVVDGEKVFITSGMRADWITLAVRTGGSGPGGISILMLPGDAPGLSRTRLDKMGWLCSDTAHLRFDGVRVPVANRVGDEGAGFALVMRNFNGERLALAVMALGFAERCYDEALDWARQRKTFGVALLQHQVLRHKFMDMKMRLESTRAWVQAVAQRADAGDCGADWVAQVCLLKNHATQTLQFCADQGVQILGGMGFMRGTACERIYREVKVLTIGGGTEEIMKELAARQLGV